MQAGLDRKRNNVGFGAGRYEFSPHDLLKFFVVPKRDLATAARIAIGLAVDNIGKQALLSNLDELFDGK